MQITEQVPPGVILADSRIAASLKIPDEANWLQVSLPGQTGYEICLYCPRCDLSDPPARVSRNAPPRPSGFSLFDRTIVRMQRYVYIERDGVAIYYYVGQCKDCLTCFWGVAER